MVIGYTSQLGQKLNQRIIKMELNSIIEEQAKELKSLVGMAMSLEECRDFIKDTFNQLKPEVR